MAKPRLYFVCIGNSHRSQMAEAFTRHHAGDAVEVRSAGSRPAFALAPDAIALMRERNIEIVRQYPKRVDWEWARAADAVVTMGCGDECPSFLSEKHRDWDLEDPKGQPPEVGRRVRDEVERRVLELLRELAIPTRK